MNIQTVFLSGQLQRRFAPHQTGVPLVIIGKSGSVRYCLYV